MHVVQVEPSQHETYVARDGVSLQHFVNRYIRTRGRPVNPGNRLAVQEALHAFSGRFPARCADLESFLDSRLLDPKAGP